MSLLSINLNLIATLRELRRQSEPDPAQAAVLAEIAGADGIAVQLRRDRRFVRDRDIYLLNALTKTRLTVEMPPAEDLITRMLEVKPYMVTFAADQVDADSPVGTIDFSTPEVDFRDLTDRFKAVGVNVCYFIEPQADQVKGAGRAGANAVMINCSAYTQARSTEEAQSELDGIDNAGRAAAKAGLSVLMGRGIGYRNVGPLAELGYVDEFVIGHAVCARAMLLGMDRAVREMLALVQASRASE